MIGLRKWIRSFRYAYEGIKYALSTQRNMKFHFFISFFVLLLALVLQLPRTEILLLLFSICLVVVTELINTSIEKTVDLAMPELHPLAKIAKDTAAASVLVSAVFAAITGAIVFYEPIQHYLQQVYVKGEISVGSVWVLLVLVAFSVIVIETRFSTRGRMRPSFFSAIAVAISTWITLLFWDALLFFLAYGLSFMVMLVLYEKKNRSLPSLIVGALIGASISVVAYYLIKL